MSSPMRLTSECKAIPRRVLISDPTDIPCSYSSTPGGTLFSTTPGGTKIVYERSFLMNIRNSPLSKTPPSWDIPDNLIKGSPNSPNGLDKKHIPNGLNRNYKKAPKRNGPAPKRNLHKGNLTEEDEQFQLEL